jgi:hypothetical protein
MLLTLRRPTLFIGIDPGVAKAYVVSLFYPNGDFSLDKMPCPIEIAATALKLRLDKDDAPWACAAHLQRGSIYSVCDLVNSMHSHQAMGHTIVAAVEGQDVSYTTRTSQAKPQSICDLSLITGAFLGVLGQYLEPGKTLFCPTPHAWKGSVPKKINQARTLTALGLPYTVKGGQRPYCVPDGWKGISAKGVTSSNWYDLSDAAGLALYAAKQFAKAGV